MALAILKHVSPLLMAMEGLFFVLISHRVIISLSSWKLMPMPIPTPTRYGYRWLSIH
jgi:hypothetical protein